MTASIRKFIFALAATCVVQGASPCSLSNRSIYQLDQAWTDDAGRTMKLAALQGHPVVLAMFYTQCPYACPMIVAAMRRIQAALPEAERRKTCFILVSFDSAHDTSAVLHAYRQEIDLPYDTWILAHGDTDAVRELAMILGVKYQKSGKDQYAHSNLITVLNDRGEIAYQRTGLQGDDSAVVAAIVHTDK